jgi:hypothetical protein
VVLDVNVDGVATIDVGVDVVVWLGGLLPGGSTDDVKVNVKGGDPVHVQVKGATRQCWSEWEVPHAVSTEISEKPSSG